jgi:formate hydrogenlyase subunit 4
LRPDLIHRPGVGTSLELKQFAAKTWTDGAVLLLAPLLTGFVRKVKARLLRRQGPPLLQPYLDLVRLMRKEVVLAESASWLFRVIPYLIFAVTLPHRWCRLSVPA